MSISIMHIPACSDGLTNIPRPSDGPGGVLNREGDGSYIALRRSPRIRLQFVAEAAQQYGCEFRLPIFESEFSGGSEFLECLGEKVEIVRYRGSTGESPKG